MLARLSPTIVAGLAVAAAGGSAMAAITPSNPLIHVDFTAGALNGFVDIDLSDINVQSIPGTAYFYPGVPAPFTIFDTANPLQAIAQGTVGILAYSPDYAMIGPPGTDPEYRIDLNFSIESLAGVAGVANVVSSNVAFPGISGATGVVSTSFSATDSNADGSLAVVGQFAGANMWNASYNGGTPFATILQGGSSAIVGDTVVGAVPAGAPGAIPGTVSSMATAYSFSVTAGDSVSGTSTFIIVPTPGAAALIAFGSVAYASRRRSR